MIEGDVSIGGASVPGSGSAGSRASDAGYPESAGTALDGWAAHHSVHPHSFNGETGAHGYRKLSTASFGINVK